jgi:hypothetical protein
LVVSVSCDKGTLSDFFPEGSPIAPVAPPTYLWYKCVIITSLLHFLPLYNGFAAIFTIAIA